jgi:hypothetical protein
MPLTVSKSSATPAWLRKSMAGVCFWIGHRQATYRGYPLGESALVAEFCNLLYANTREEPYEVACEVAYKVLLGLKPSSKESRRADVCLFLEQSDKSNAVKFVFEVKRYCLGKSEIDADLKKSLEIKRKSPQARVFVAIFSEGKLPKEYVTTQGTKSKEEFQIEGDGFAKTVAVMKAIKVMKKIDEGHFSCALEIFLKGT